MKQPKMTGLQLTGRIPKAGITLYERGGRIVLRPSKSHQPKRRYRAVFIAQQQQKHSSRLWTPLKWAGEPLFDKAPTAYARFRSLMHRTPVVFTPKSGPMSGATFLLPGMPVSDGVLPVVEQWLDEVDGTPALLTSLSAADLQRGDLLRFYTLKQCTDSFCPLVRIKSDDLNISDFREVDGRLALVSDDFADEMTGWALVHVRPKRKRGRQPEYRCSSQTVVTRCTYYLPFTTEEALLAAADSYGGLTEEVLP